MNLADPLVEWPVKGTANGVQSPNFNVGPQQFAPGLATSWKRTNPTTWVMKLRKGVKSCAGNELTANDVVYTFARIKSVSGGAPTGWFGGHVMNIFSDAPVKPNATAADKQLHGEVKALDRYTVQFKQLGPNALFPVALVLQELYPLDSKYMKQHATASDPWAHKWADQRGAMGFGPYCVADWQKSQRLVLRANPNYWRGQPTFKTVTIRAVPSIADRVAALRTGSADLTNFLTAHDVNQLKGAQGVSVLSWCCARQTYFGVNFKFAPWNTPKAVLLRKAIAYAIPYDDIINDAYFGEAQRSTGFMVPNTYGSIPVLKGQYTTDLNKAKQLLAQAGFPGGKGLSKYGKGMTVYFAAEQSPVLEPVATLIRSNLAKIGVQISLNPIPEATFDNMYCAPKTDMPAFINYDVKPFIADAEYASLLQYVSTTPGGGLCNTGNYRSAKFDALYAQSTHTLGQARLKLLAQMQQVLAQDMPVVPIVQTPYQIAVRSGISNWKVDATGYVRYWFLRG